MKNVLMFIGILLLCTTVCTAILGFPETAVFSGVCWSIVTIVYLVINALD